MDSESVARRAAVIQDYEEGLHNVLEVATTMRNSGGNGGLIKGLREELEEAKMKLLLQEAELKASEKELEELKQAKTEGVQQVVDGAHVGKVTELETLKGEFKSFKEQAATEAAEGKDQLLTKDREMENLKKQMTLKKEELQQMSAKLVQSQSESKLLLKDTNKMVGELGVKHTKIQELSMEVRVLQQTQMEMSGIIESLRKELEEERLSAKRKFRQLRGDLSRVLDSHLSDPDVGTEEEEEHDDDDVSDDIDEDETGADTLTTPPPIDPGTGRARRKTLKRNYAKMMEGDPDYGYDFYAQAKNSKSVTGRKGPAQPTSLPAPAPATSRVVTRRKLQTCEICGMGPFNYINNLHLRSKAHLAAVASLAQVKVDEDSDGHDEGNSDPKIDEPTDGGGC